MPAAYAHITLVNLAREGVEGDGFPRRALAALGRHLKYAELGAVAPDFPYFAVGNAAQKAWADRMHYERTGELLHAGIRLLRAAGGDVEKRLAWLLGFASHVVMDVTVHPVVELRVGPYHEHQTEHRICEMHQDVYIYQRMNLGLIGESEHVRSGMAATGPAGDRGRMDPEIAALWGAMLGEVYPDAAAAAPPAFDTWHGRFVVAVDDIAEEGVRVGPLARHVLAGAGYMYPAKQALDATYLRGLRTPGGGVQTYDEVFDAAVGNVQRVWRDVATGVLEGSAAHLASIANWNLDTGRDPSGAFGFWRVA